MPPKMGRLTIYVGELTGMSVTSWKIGGLLKFVMIYFSPVIISGN